MHSPLRFTVLIATAISAAALGACSSNTASPASGTVVVRLTDAAFPIDSVKRADVFIVRIDARTAATDSSAATTGTSDDSASTGGWTTIARPNAALNLLAYQNGVNIVVGQTPLAAGTYQGFRLIIDAGKSSISLKDGTVLTGSGTPGIVFPSASRSGIKIQMAQPLTIVTGDSTTVVVDFDLGNSFVMRGNSLAKNGLLFKPVVTATVH